MPQREGMIGIYCKMQCPDVLTSLCLQVRLGKRSQKWVRGS